MTQKELLYLEDAYGHEGNIVKICEEIIKNLEDEKLIMFMEKEINVHNSLKEKLLSMLEVKANE